jgi:hypothetical protein
MHASPQERNQGHLAAILSRQLSTPRITLAAHHNNGLISCRYAAKEPTTAI